MTNKEKLNLLEEVLDIEKGTLDEETELSQIEEWDSIAVITLIAMVDDFFGKVIMPEDVKRFKTVKDIIDQME